MKTQTLPEISFIGSGKVATAFAENLFRKGFPILNIYSRHYKNAATLSKKVKAKAVKNIRQIKDTGIIIIAVKDDAIETVSKKLTGKTAIILHTSGTADIKILKRHKKNGIIYPLQTFTISNKTDLNNIPLLIEASDKKSMDRIQLVASAISKKVLSVSSSKRLKIHLAAVLVSNFTNHLFARAEEIMNKEKLSFEILLPLIESVFENLKKSPAKSNQTGPALRKDSKTMKSHLKILKADKRLYTIYREISKDIESFHSKK